MSGQALRQGRTIRLVATMACQRRRSAACRTSSGLLVRSLPMLSRADGAGESNTCSLYLATDLAVRILAGVSR